MMSTPNSSALQVGPMDPDNTAELTNRYGVANNSLDLLKGQADNQPVELMSILAVPPDAERSEALDRDEVVRASGDLLAREGSALLSAYVRGDHDGNRVVTINYQVPSGRTGKAALGLWAENFPKSVAAFEGIRRLRMGVAAAGAAAYGAADVPAASPELEALRATLEEQAKTITELQNPEPSPGYRELNATDAATAVYDMDSSQLDAVERFENGTGRPRSTVLRAIEKRRDDLDAERADLEALRAARAAGRDPFAEPSAPAGDGGTGDDSGS